MSEKEMAQEIERLRHELVEVTRSRDRLREMICKLWPVPEITPEEFERMLKNARPVDEVLRDIIPPDLHEEILGPAKRAG